MRQPSLDEGDLDLLAKAWEISEEGEDLADCAREHLAESWDAITRLASSSRERVRWQVYDVVAAAGKPAQEVLRRGLEDPDPYCRRRAILSIARTHPADSEEIARRFLSDGDPYIRQAALELVEVSDSRALREQAIDLLKEDPVEHVRRAAERLARW